VVLLDYSSSYFPLESMHFQETLENSLVGRCNRWSAIDDPVLFHASSGFQRFTAIDCGFHNVANKVPVNLHTDP
jgi:hypothetical protein